MPKPWTMVNRMPEVPGWWITSTWLKALSSATNINSHAQVVWSCKQTPWAVNIPIASLILYYFVKVLNKCVERACFYVFILNSVADTMYFITILYIL